MELDFGLVEVNHGDDGDHLGQCQLGNLQRCSQDCQHPHDQECIADGLGDVLHAANGEETTAVANPPVTNVPWSNFDGLSRSLISKVDHFSFRRTS